MRLIRWETDGAAVVGYCGQVEVARIDPSPVRQGNEQPQRVLERFNLSLEIPFDSHRAYFSIIDEAQKEAEFVVGRFKRLAGW